MCMSKSKHLTNKRKLEIIEGFHASKLDDKPVGYRPVTRELPVPAYVVRAAKAQQVNQKLAAFKPITHKLGGIGELTVCANLLRSGFSVFRAVADHEDCDVVAIKGGKVYRVEVRTCRRGPGGKIFYPKGDPAKYDVMAAVDHFGGVTYIPPFVRAPHGLAGTALGADSVALETKSPPGQYLDSGVHVSGGC